MLDGQDLKRVLLHTRLDSILARAMNRHLLGLYR